MADVRPILQGDTMDDPNELTGDEWREWMAQRLASRSGRYSMAAARKSNAQRKQAQVAIDAAAKAESDAIHAEYERPRTRGECGTERPCPWVGCRHNLYLDVSPDTGVIKIRFPDREPWEIEHSCSLDLADDASITLERVGEILNVTRERVRQIETQATRRLIHQRRRLT